MLIADWSNKKLPDADKALAAEHHRLYGGNQPEFGMWLSCPERFNLTAFVLLPSPPPADILHG